MSFSPTQRGEPLSEQEIEILTAVAHGLTDTAIGARLHISIHTVKSHMQRINVKLGSCNRANMVAKGFVHGYLKPTRPVPVPAGVS